MMGVQISEIAFELEKGKKNQKTTLDKSLHNVEKSLHCRKVFIL